MISTAHVERFLEREQQDARQWLRDEMDQLVDQMFGQLRCKFMDSLKESEFSSGFLANGDQILSSLEGFSTTSLDLEVDTRMDQQTFHDQLDHNQEPIPELIPELIPEKFQEPVIKQKFYDTDDEENILHDSDEEDCDCEDCTTLDSAIKLENENEVEDTQDQSPNWFQEPVTELVPEPSTTGTSTKRPRLDPEVPNNQTVPEYVQESTVYKILTPKCILTNCYKKFTDAPELDQHLLHGHGIHRFRCALANCNRSFPESTNLGDHLREYHGNLTEFSCAFCSKHFTRYDQLHLHTAQHHHGGRFHCSYPNCDFVASFRDTVSRHYATHNTTAIVCNFEGCGHRFKNSTFAKAHKRAHLGIVPYRCRWPGCGYAHAARSTAMNHIWRIHFKVPDDKRKNRNVGRGCGDPRDFLEVNRELL